VGEQCVCTKNAGSMLDWHYILLNGKSKRTQEKSNDSG
jgi:hypothetical protein